MMTCGLDKFFIISHSPALWLFSIRQDHRESCSDSLLPVSQQTAFSVITGLVVTD